MKGGASNKSSICEAVTCPRRITKFTVNEFQVFQELIAAIRLDCNITNPSGEIILRRLSSFCAAWALPWQVSRLQEYLSDIDTKFITYDSYGTIIHWPDIKFQLSRYKLICGESVMETRGRQIKVYGISKCKAVNVMYHSHSGEATWLERYTGAYGGFVDEPGK